MINSNGYAILAADVTEHQFIRELIINSAQAGARKVEIGPCAFNRSCVSFKDDGPGISNLLDRMALFTETQEGNKGIGGKIASLRFSPFRVEFHTKTKGQPAEAISINISGKIETIPSKFKGSHGTEVVLFGKKEGLNTVDAPSRGWVRLTNRWMWESVPNLQISVWDNTKDRTYRTAKGVKHFMYKHAKHHGTMDLIQKHGVRVHWIILPDSVQEKSEYSLVSNFLNFSGGVTAVLYQNELYDIRTGPDTWLPMFGIRLGRPRVGIFIEVPDNSSRYAPNAVRTTIKAAEDGMMTKAFPVEEIGETFKNRMPVELEKMLEELKGRSVQVSNYRYFNKVAGFFSNFFSTPGSYLSTMESLDSLLPGVLPPGPPDPPDPGNETPSVVDRDNFRKNFLIESTSPRNKNKRGTKGVGLPNVDIKQLVTAGPSDPFVTCWEKTNELNEITVMINPNSPKFNILQRNLLSNGTKMDSSHLVEKMGPGLTCVVMSAIQQSRINGDINSFKTLTSNEALEASIYANVMYISRGAGANEF